MGSLVGELIAHPQSKSRAVSSITAGIGREYPDVLYVMFKLQGDLNRIRSVSSSGPRERLDNLWKTTCFECFVSEAGKSQYSEFNFSPRGGWAAYSFAAYREGMKILNTPIRPYGTDEIIDSSMFLGRHLVLPSEIEPRRSLSWQIGLSAVIEESDGNISYWSLAHPPGQPDFHHPDCFTLELPPPEYSYEIRN